MYSVQSDIGCPPEEILVHLDSCLLCPWIATTAQVKIWGLTSWNLAPRFTVGVSKLIQEDLLPSLSFFSLLSSFFLSFFFFFFFFFQFLNLMYCLLNVQIFVSSVSWLSSDLHYRPQSEVVSVLRCCLTLSVPQALCACFWKQISEILLLSVTPKEAVVCA